MIKKGHTSTQALEAIKSKRGFIDPNIGFIGQLMALEGKREYTGPRLFAYTLTRERIVAKTLQAGFEEGQLRGLLEESPPSLVVLKDCVILCSPSNTDQA